MIHFVPMVTLQYLDSVVKSVTPHILNGSNANLVNQCIDTCESIELKQDRCDSTLALDMLSTDCGTKDSRIYSLQENNITNMSQSQNKECWMMFNSDNHLVSSQQPSHRMIDTRQLPSKQIQQSSKRTILLQSEKTNVKNHALSSDSKTLLEDKLNSLSSKMSPVTTSDTKPVYIPIAVTHSMSSKHRPIHVLNDQVVNGALKPIGLLSHSPLDILKPTSRASPMSKKCSS